MENKFQILLYYKYADVQDPEELKQSQIELCKKLNLKGRIIVAHEGINGTVEGTVEDTEKYVDSLLKDERFKDTDIKRSEGTGNSFPRLSVKVRPELVSAKLGEDDVNPNELTGIHLKPEELNQWFEKGKKFYIIDMRNDYEHKIGHFENSILPKLSNFRDLPNELPELEKYKNETVLTVCTGGVRCEKASGYLKKKGFKDVYQLDGGIVSYMEKYPNQDFLGKLYVFDGRVAMGFNLEDESHVVISDCSKCGGKSDNYIDCAYIHCRGNRHFLCCEKCLENSENKYCREECFELDSKK